MLHPRTHNNMYTPPPMMPTMPAAIPALFPMGKYPVPQSLPAFPGWPPGAFVRCCSFASPCHYPLQVSGQFHTDTKPRAPRPGLMSDGMQDVHAPCSRSRRRHGRASHSAPKQTRRSTAHGRATVLTAAMMTRARAAARGSNECTRMPGARTRTRAVYNTRGCESLPWPGRLPCGQRR
jgi:hypothetical protein